MTAPAPEGFVVKTAGTCRELAENHSQALVILLDGIRAVERGVGEIKLAQNKHENKMLEQSNALKAIDVLLRGSATWQIGHEKEHDGAQKAAAEKHKLWDTITTTAISTGVRAAIVGAIAIMLAGLWTIAQEKISARAGSHAPTHYVDK